MPQQFTGKVEFLDSQGNAILTIDPDSTFVQITYKTPSGFQMMQLTNTSSFSLWGPGDDHGARLDGVIGTLFLGGAGRTGRIFMRDGDKKEIITLDVSNNGGTVVLCNSSGKETIRLDGSSGDVILANADCAEDFDLASAATVDPGTVMVLNQEGALHPSTAAYDKTVAGVVSGAGDYKPGIVLDRRPSDSPRIPLALVGKTYCKVDATYSSVEVGDLLTTSSTVGHAMRADDQAKAFGAVIGKALRPLKEGQGMIPILIALQ